MFVYAWFRVHTGGTYSVTDPYSQPLSNKYTLVLLLLLLLLHLPHSHPPPLSPSPLYNNDQGHLHLKSSPISHLGYNSSRSQLETGNLYPLFPFKFLCYCLHKHIKLSESKLISKLIEKGIE